MAKNLTIFAGPNGSGKSTFKDYFISKFQTGIYVNADDIEIILNSQKSFNFNDYSIITSFDEFYDFYLLSSWKSTVLDNFLVSEISIINNILKVNSSNIESYLAALLSDFIREKLLHNNIDFSFETVMSHPSKIEILKKAKILGYTITLIFVTTNNPEINVNRVAIRVKKGGHNVPNEKIISRYYKCMDLLYDAFLISDIAFLYDNSGSFSTIDEMFVAQKFDNKITLGKYKFDWFEKYVIDKIPKK